MDHLSAQINCLKPLVSKYTAVFGGEFHRFIGFECDVSMFCEYFKNIFHDDKKIDGKESYLNVLKLAVYVSSIEIYENISEILFDYLEVSVHSIEVIWQKPASGAQLGVNIWLVSGVRECTAGRGLLEGVRQKYMTLGFYSCSKEKANLKNSIEDMFTESWRESSEYIERRGLSFASILRTWIYIQDINVIDNGEENYQRVNLARKNIFREIRSKIDQSMSYYPGSTGIGQDSGKLGMSILACSINSNYIIEAVENDDQVSAYYYPAKESKVPPLFSRAIMIRNESEALVIISGTASILESQSVHIDNVRLQTEQTLININTLLRTEKLEFNGVLKKGLETIVTCVVYIKRAEDYNAVKSICEKRLPSGAVKLYTVADVCRSDLLVEIEAVGIIRN